jgi:predicted nucleotidyltransferase
LRIAITRSCPLIQGLRYDLHTNFRIGSSDYDVAIVLRDPSDRRHFRRILSDLAYEHVLDGFFIRPVLLPLEDFEPHGRRLTELAEDIIRDGIEIA